MTEATQYDRLIVAIAEAKRFLAAAEKCRTSAVHNPVSGGGHYIEVTPSLNAATKRASMDLTKAIAAYRKP